jgi:hypothetical protein
VCVCVCVCTLTQHNQLAPFFGQARSWVCAMAAQGLCSVVSCMVVLLVCRGLSAVHIERLSVGCELDGRLSGVGRGCKQHGFARQEDFVASLSVSHGTAGFRTLLLCPCAGSGCKQGHIRPSERLHAWF